MAIVDLTRSNDRMFRIMGNYTESPTVQKVGKANPYAPTLRIATGKGGRPGNYGFGSDRPTTYKTIKNPFYISPEQARVSAVAAAAEENRAFKQRQEELFKSQQADIAEQLKIIKGEKSAVSKLMEDYRNMLIKEADAKRKAQEEQQVALQTARANAARSSVGSNLQIQLGGGVRPFSDGSMSRRSGSGQFKRRLNIGQSNMVNI